MTKPKIYTVAELSARWNESADEHNQWATLGIDEIVEFVQQECAVDCRAALARFVSAAEMHHRSPCDSFVHLYYCEEKARAEEVIYGDAPDNA